MCFDSIKPVLCWYRFLELEKCPKNPQLLNYTQNSRAGQLIELLLTTNNAWPFCWSSGGRLRKDWTFSRHRFAHLQRLLRREKSVKLSSGFCFKTFRKNNSDSFFAKNSIKLATLHGLIKPCAKLNYPQALKVFASLRDSVSTCEQYIKSDFLHFCRP